MPKTQSKQQLGVRGEDAGLAAAHRHDLFLRTCALGVESPRQLQCD